MLLSCLPHGPFGLALALFGRCVAVGAKTFSAHRCLVAAYFLQSYCKFWKKTKYAT